MFSLQPGNKELSTDYYLTTLRQDPFGNSSTSMLSSSILLTTFSCSAASRMSSASRFECLPGD